MTAVQISVSRGASLAKITDFTIGTSAPGVGDIEVRYNLTDTNGGVLLRKDIILALDGMLRALKSGALVLTSPVL
jgi:hypothetical protein